jgi:nitrogen fixation-related uncharacterized protein
MSLYYILIWGFAAVCGLTAVEALVWAVRSGQLRNFAAGAASIFDDEEPIGTTTDAFPRAPVEPISRTPREAG